MQTQLIPTAEPFFFPGGPVGCLLIHGFTGTPKEMRWMGEYLAKQGHSVLGVRLAAHATQPADMTRVQWHDWLASVEDGWHMLQGSTSRIFVIGLSMGGVLSLLFASHFPVAGVVAISTPYALPPDRRLPYVKWLSLVKPRIEKGPPDWHDPEGAADHVAYDFYPTRAMAELRDLMASMRSSLPQVTAPSLLFHSRQDTSSFDPHSMENIYNQIGSKDKQMVWVENSGHVITREPDRWQVFEQANQFVERITQSQPV